MSSGAACLARPVREPATERPVVASTALRPVLAALSPGAAAEGTVLAALPAALYVAVPGEVVAVVTRDAVRLPNAAVLPSPAAQAPFAVHVAGAPAEVRDGALHVATREGGQVAYRPVREWAPRPVLPGPPASVRASVVDDLARRLEPDPACDSPAAARLAAATADLRCALVCGDLGRARAAADRLIGLGPGLTPAGDDVLAGLLVTCHQLRTSPAAARVVALTEPLGQHVVQLAATSHDRAVRRAARARRAGPCGRPGARRRRRPRRARSARSGADSAARGGAHLGPRHRSGRPRGGGRAGR
jgi:hypothetical protein